MSGTTIISVALALLTVLVAFGAVAAGRPAARRLLEAERGRNALAWLLARVSPSLLVITAGALLVATLLNVFLEILDAVLEGDDLTVIDRPAVAWIAEQREAWRDTLVISLTDIGGKIGLTLLLAAAAITVTVRLRAVRPALIAALAGGGGALLVTGIKALIARDRPDPLLRAIVENGFSFPSGHATTSLVVLGTVAWLVSMATASHTARATAWVAAGLLAGGIGLSRIYLGVHYPTDVLAGWILGSAWLATVALADRLPGLRLRLDGPAPLARYPRTVTTVTVLLAFALILAAVWFMASVED
ncbi:undecaprenyl-diphosphatase [Catenuloplanes nepalensis]|uniref:Undecaprenyl-diphosphatase n=1 Tax=Catenuloplanes nepalensis TaxID=587533 RepID=A0ABT9MMW4_9ACTN|nr:phosphatase PAP2 family protein [Catenuloplanes nepalensis]MDP9792779.1 undecaprenyl-diphosphatase [Catenuloplanes nepalensis]